MNNRTVIIIILLIAEVVLIAGAYALGTRLRGDSSIDKPSKISDVVKSTAIVEVTDKGFTPGTVKVKKGTLITFVNKGKKTHRVSSDPHPVHTGLAGFDSPTLAKGDTYFFLFDKAGTFTFHDHLNPLKFKGTIIVQ